MNTPANFRDLTGQRFAKLIAVRRSGRTDNRWTVFWECHCDCGNTKTIRARYLTSGKTRSCGCITAFHGMSQTAEFIIWGGMLARCTNPNGPKYHRYGGRGIKICDRWRESFLNFYADVGPRPGPEYSLDRFPNRDGNYEPGNVRWATIQEQNNNRSNTRYVTYRGRSMALTDAIKVAGSIISREVAYDRIVRLSWPVDKALEAPMEPGASRKRAKERGEVVA